MPIKLAIIIVTYNSEKYLEKCLLSLKESFDNFSNSENKKNGLNLKIFIVDNSPNNESLIALEKIKKSSDFFNDKIIFKKNKQNLGFAATVNQGFELSRENFDPNWFFLLNPDAFLAADFFGQMFEMIHGNPNLDVLSPLILNPKNQTVWFYKGIVDFWKLKTFHLPMPKNLFLKNETILLNKNEYLTGCALWIKKNVLKKIGGMDEKFFLYYEDADFCLRALKENFKLTTVSQAKCFHDESKSFEKNEKAQKFELQKKETGQIY